ncbi:AP-3 complex subunit beta-1-like isoform X4 [Branchiostoma floridae x Branchiostoma belcheri]
MSNGGGSYNAQNDSRAGSTGEPDMGTEPTGGFFSADYKKHDDLKQMLDSNKDNLKLEAMKRIVGMVAKGKDASDLFAAVVKNVVSKNIEVKKLVYVYLVRYAEEQQDLALLSIATFQRALKDPNQLIRASALRVLSSIRVPVIVPIMMLALKDSVVDMSPYVRKTAAHAIPKLYSLDPEQKDQLIQVIEKLLADKTTLVVGSAVMAFEELCPDRVDLIHKNYRKLCNLLVDVEEWGQVVIINMLTRYARTQFLDPNQQDVVADDDKNFYGDEDEKDSEEEEEDEEKEKTPPKKPYMMDPDHRLLLRNTKPLLQSRNAAVVMAVAQLYHHIAPKSEVGLVAKALVRLLRSHREIQHVVLSNVATLTTIRKGMFEPYLKSFFVRPSDPIHVRTLKLEILTNLATETSISTILREFQTYVTSSDKDFVAATIQAIGRCASSISEVTETCLNGLVGLLSNRNEYVVAESVVVIKKLLQMQPDSHSEIIQHMAKLADTITVPMARASILWMVGEYSDRVPKIAPDLLRKMAKNFINEEDIVKLQILNLAAKLCITNPKQTKLLCQYVLNLAKYDQNYDIRDRARFIRQLVSPAGEKGALGKHAKKIFLASKPAPVLDSSFKDRDQWQLGSLSHMINQRASGYSPLPDFPATAPDPTVRNVEVPMPWAEKTHKKKAGKPKKEAFYSDEEEESESESDSEESSSSSSESGSESESEDDSKSESGSDKEEKKSDEEAESSSSSSSESESSSESDSDSDSESEPDTKPQKKTPPPKSKSSAKPKKEAKQEVSLLDLEDKSKENADSAPSQAAEEKDPTLLDTEVDMSSTSAPVPTPASALDVLSPSLASDLQGLSINDKKDTAISVTTPMFVSTTSHELLHRMTGEGLAANYRFTRGTCIYSTSMVPVELTFTNHTDSPVSNIRIGEKKLQAGMTLQEFPEIPTLPGGGSMSVSIGIDFKDTIQPANFQICTQDRKYNVSIKPPVGELLQAVTMSEADFTAQQSKLTGMNENSGKASIPSQHNNSKTITSRISELANVAPVSSSQDGLYRFAGKTVSGGTLLLVTVKVGEDNSASITVNCEKMAICSMLVKEVKQKLSQA